MKFRAHVGLRTKPAARGKLFLKGHIPTRITPQPLPCVTSPFPEILARDDDGEAAHQESDVV